MNARRHRGLEFPPQGVEGLSKQPFPLRTWGEATPVQAPVCASVKGVGAPIPSL